jgi:hypothetical protein
MAAIPAPTPAASSDAVRRHLGHPICELVERELFVA